MTITRVDNRLIYGAVVPWNVEVVHGFRRWKYLPDSVRVDGPLNLVRDHDSAQRVGLVVAYEVTPDALRVTGWVRPSPNGDRALALANNGGMLSAHLEEIEFEKCGEVCVVHSAVLRHEVSIVKRGAIPGTDITREG